MKLSRIEQETVILYNQEEPTARISTQDPAFIRKLANLASNNEAVSLVEERTGYAEYVVPKKYIKVFAPRLLTDEQKQVMSERMRIMRAKQKEGQET